MLKFKKSSLCGRDRQTDIHMEERSIHVGIIPDGNRRWCRSNNKAVMDLVQMQRAMLLNVLKEQLWVTTYNCLKYVGELTVYLLSKDNLLKRQDNTVEMVGQLLEFLADDIKAAPNLAGKARIRFVGELALLPPNIQLLCADIERITEHGQILLTCAIAYDPVVDSERWLRSQNSKRGRPIDMVIRTGGEFRSSGFFPMQTLYSEWFFLPKMFPELTLKDIDNVISAFFSRNRRFGA